MAEQPQATPLFASGSDYGNVSMKDYEMLHQLHGFFPGSSFSPGLALTIGVMNLIGLVVANSLKMVI
ncbi:MAG: hypothetical protein ACLQBD_22065 [Syntrophobacteraceae bacterium]